MSQSTRPAGAGAGDVADAQLGAEFVQSRICSPRYKEKHEEELRRIAESKSDDPAERGRILRNLLMGYHIEPSYGMDPVDPFVRCERHLKSLYVTYNMNHPLMGELAGLLGSVSGLAGASAEALEAGRRLRRLFDGMMAGLVQSRMSMEDFPGSETIENVFNCLMGNWGGLSHRYAGGR